METNDRRYILRLVEMTLNRINNHRAEFLKRIALRGDAVAQGLGNIAAIDWVFFNLKDDLAHTLNNYSSED